MAKDILRRLTWAASAAAGTAVEVVGESLGHADAAALVMVHNPSAVTALTVSVRVRFIDTGNVNRDAELATLAVPVGATRATRVAGLGMGVPVIRATNDTATGVGQGFDAELRVEFVGG